MMRSSEQSLSINETNADFTRCSRCQGLMVIEDGFDSMIGAAEVSTPLRRCVQCGEVTDAVILFNRRAQRESQEDAQGGKRGLRGKAVQHPNPMQRSLC
ncbi:MAG TPA: hypothetical protein PKD12_00760 [Nitrospira sp.]|nr:hypothetical protein [Nitrospira sp.]